MVAAVCYRTSELIDRLLRMVWQTALPPTICVIVNAAVLEARPIETSHIIFNSVLPKLYANSLLYTLNSRNEIRSRQTSPLSTGYHITTSASGRGGAATATTMTTRNSTVGRVDLSVFGREEDTSSRGGATSPTAGDGREERRVSIRFEEEARKPEVFEFARLDLKSGEISDADGK
ncbi:hypothetical protein FRC17_006375 [Serendipita sp. 399]|nr:hypothetical protein FRC17_006375 [Serendipita sp. 399]